MQKYTAQEIQEMDEDSLEFSSIMFHYTFGEEKQCGNIDCECMKDEIIK